MGGLSPADLGSAGPILVVLAVLSLVSVAVVIARLMALWGVGAGAEAREAAFDQLEASNEGGSAIAMAEPGTPADRIARRALAMLGQGAGPDRIDAELTGLGASEIASMGRGLRFLELVGMIAPLLGLLGTVAGMIQSFRSLELAAGSANASILAGGIWQALLTTAAGLLVAIPALVGASIIAGRVEAGTLQIERVIARAATIAARRRDPPARAAE